MLEKSLAIALKFIHAHQVFIRNSSFWNAYDQKTYIYKREFMGSVFPSN
jgi:hypothetical protein